MQSGSGLGVHHARETVEKSGGRLSIQSQVGAGTQITLTLPRVETPKWFVEKISVPRGATVASVDDDQTIHQIWAGRLSSAGAMAADVQHLTFSSLEQFESWAIQSVPNRSIFLVDFEFLAQSGNGLDTIERTGISSKAILVTSRYEEPHVRARADAMGVRILPKTLAPFVPLAVEKSLERFAAVLIDDDNLVHMTWQMAAKEKGVEILCFASLDGFWARATEIDRSTPVYIDVSLADGVRGENVAGEVLARGFTNVSLATGHSPNSITPPPGVRGVVGKDPKF
jgi:FixJ family two-component response regulator